MVASKGDEFIYKILSEGWEELFGALQYTPRNFNPVLNTMNHNFLDFLKTESKFLSMDVKLPENFDYFVSLRFRAQFLFEFALLHIFSEDEASKFAINVSDAETRSWLTLQPSSWTSF